uniref:hypothetical protein n=1 Tax=Thaumasiovibrio occultus TaxID=1891184 RepID=UPI000B3509C0|nr:hypothetical protein [Thaumasiovibrio occultus]
MWFKRLLLLALWVVISFTIAAQAGDSAVIGALLASGPAFIAGDYVSYGFSSNEIEFYMQIAWLVGLATFVMRMPFIVVYILSLMATQLWFINVVNDPLLYSNTLMLLFPAEIVVLIASVFLLSAKANKNAIDRKRSIFK